MHEIGIQNHELNKVVCAFPMVILSDFRMGEHRDDNHEEDEPYFKTLSLLPIVYYIKNTLEVTIYI